MLFSLHNLPLLSINRRPHFVGLPLFCFFSILSPVLRGQMFIDQAFSMGVNGLITSEAYGSGVSVYDFNRDGLDDITLATNHGNLLLYENQGDGFELINPGLHAPGQTKHVLWVDYDNDGILDLFLTSYNGPCRLYKNCGDFSFADMTAAAGLPTTGYNAGASFGDYDGDGYLDLYLCKYADDNFTPFNPNMHNQLFRNMGNGTFQDVTASAGVSTPLALTFQSVWLDYNNDNRPDLFIINDRIHINKFFENNGDGTFTDVTASANMGFLNNDVMSNTVGDYNNDGYLDIFMTNTGSITPPRPTLLCENQGDGTYLEKGEDMGVQIFYNSWGALWIDADNDTWQDLYFTTSDLTANYFFINEGGEQFLTAQSEVVTGSNRPCWSAAKGDFNNDGFYDMAVQSRTPNRPHVFMNQAVTENAYLKITLEGSVSNHFAIGSWIRAYHDGVHHAEYTLCGENYYGQNSGYYIFGLGDADIVDSVLVTYRSGHTDKYFNLEVDSSYYFTEGETYHVEIVSETGLSFCAGGSVLLDAGEHATYQWSTGDTTRFLNVSTGGTYAVTAKNEFGLEADDAVIVSVNPLPVVSYDVWPVLCFGDSSGAILLQNQSQVPAEAVSWDNGLQGILLQNIPFGTYAYNFVDTNGCFSNGVVQLSESPEMIVFTEVTAATSAQSNGSLNVSVFGGTPPYELFLDEEPVSGFITGLSAGSYELKTKDLNECTELTNIIINNVLNNDKTDVLNIICYPNPAGDMVFIRSDEVLFDLRITDIYGKTIHEGTGLFSGAIDVTLFAPGMYTILLFSQHGTVVFTKFIKL